MMRLAPQLVAVAREVPMPRTGEDGEGHQRENMKGIGKRKKGGGISESTQTRKSEKCMYLRAQRVRPAAKARSPIRSRTTRRR